MILIYQWIVCAVGVISAGVTVFSFIALWKKNEKIEREMINPARTFFKKQI